MPYLRNSNPYSSGYAIPRYVEEEFQNRAITSPGLPRRTIGAPQRPVVVSSGLPRRTVFPLPPPDFIEQTGKVYPSGTLGALGGLGSLGADTYGNWANDTGVAKIGTDAAVAIQQKIDEEQQRLIAPKSSGFPTVLLLGGAAAVAAFFLLRKKR